MAENPNSFWYHFKRLFRTNTPLTDFTRPFGFNSFTSSLDNDVMDMDRTLYPRFIQVMKYVFWIVGLIALVLTCYVLFNMNPPRQIASVLIFLIGLTALFFYYTKWFNQDPNQAKENQSMCPDYLTPISPPDGDTSGDWLCMDFVGVSTNGALLKAEVSKIQTQRGDPNYTLRLNPKNKGDLQDVLCKYGLSWVAMFGDELPCKNGMTSSGQRSMEIGGSSGFGDYSQR